MTMTSVTGLVGGAWSKVHAKAEFCLGKKARGIDAVR